MSPLDVVFKMAMPGFEIFGEEERREVLEVLETGVLMRYGFDAARRGIWKATALESSLAERLGVGHAHVCSSGTAAVFTALVCHGVGVGDEVIVPPFTFVADIEAVLFSGAEPVFAEIDATLNLSASGIEAAISERTRAVLLVHMCGSMADIGPIRELCDRRGLILIEDAAQAMGARYQGKALGTLGHAGCFSFDYVKTLTCGEGGAVVTNNKEIHERIQAFTDHGHDHLGSDRGAEQHPIMGLNFRISELHAAVGLAQLRKLDTILEIQRRHWRVLAEAVSGLPDVELRRIPDPDGDACAFLSFFLPSESVARAAAKELAAGGLDGCFYWYDNNWHYVRRWEHFRKPGLPSRLAAWAGSDSPRFAQQSLPQSDALIGRTISLLIKLAWTPEEVQKRADLLRGCLERVLAAGR